MNTLPPLALSVRQPWAHGIIHLGKDIENRDWRPGNPGLGLRGSICIHAAVGMTKEEYEDARGFMEIEIGWRLKKMPSVPPANELIRGAIIGVVDVIDVVRGSMSPWFVGPVGLVLANPRPVDPIPCKGQLGFFRWQEGGAIAQPAKWMLTPDLLGEG